MEPPGENAQRTWDAIVFPKNPTFVDITKVLRKLSGARLMMVRCRMFDASPEALEREMYDLKKKIPVGSPLRVHLYGRGLEPPDFDRFLDSVQRYQFALERGKHEPGRLGEEEGDRGDVGWDEAKTKCSTTKMRSPEWPLMTVGKRQMVCAANLVVLLVELVSTRRLSPKPLVVTSVRVIIRFVLVRMTSLRSADLTRAGIHSCSVALWTVMT